MNRTKRSSALGYYIPASFLWLLIFNFLYSDARAQAHAPDYSLLLTVPKQYSILRTHEKIMVDGKDDEPDWNKAPWTDTFSDIVTGIPGSDNHEAKCKLLWDDQFLYVFAVFQEQDIWASITQPDLAIFQDNAFEIFINPDGSGHHYFEMQINALATIADLYLSKPYRNSGRALGNWDIKGLQKAVHINGTLNDPADRDTQWTIELAIPFSDLGFRFTTVKPGTIWRINFSRVQWQLDKTNGSYTRKRDQASGKLLPEHYSVWSPQGQVNLHLPERWGYVQFSDTQPAHGFLNETAEWLKLNLWKYYYLQQLYRRKTNRYANTLNQLDTMGNRLPDMKVQGATIRLLANEKQFYIEGRLTGSNLYYAVDHNGVFHTEKRK